MQFGQLLEKIERFQSDGKKGRIFIHYAVKHGWIKPRKIQKAKIARSDFSGFDLEKLKLLVVFVLDDHLSWSEASTKAESILREKSKKVEAGEIKMMLVDSGGKPLKGEKVLLPGIDLGMETDSNGFVESLEFPPGTLIKNPGFEEVTNAYSALLKFLEGWTTKGWVTEKTLDAIKYQIDKYADWADTHSKDRKIVFDSIAAFLVGTVGELCERADPELQVFPEDIINILDEDLKDFSLRRIRVGEPRKDIGPEELHSNGITSGLFYAGYYGKWDNKIRLGYTKQKQARKLPGSISVSVKNLDNLYESSYLKKFFIEQIIRQYDLDVQVDKLLNYTAPPPEDVEEFIRLISETVSYLRKKFAESFIATQDSFAFYDQAQSFYTPSSREIHVFSLTPGILIPEEYEGNIAQKKNPYRKKYFDRAIPGEATKGVPKFYQWDMNKTAVQLWKNFQKWPEETRNFYKERAIDLLAGFFQVPNLEITEADFSKSPWKMHFTLVSHQGILFSVRKAEIKEKISHGIVAGVDTIRNANLMKAFSKGLKTAQRQLSRFDDICDMVREAYSKENHALVKGRNQTFSRPKDIARDVVENLLDRGSRLSKEKGNE